MSHFWHPVSSDATHQGPPLAHREKPLSKESNITLLDEGTSVSKMTNRRVALDNERVRKSGVTQLEHETGIAAAEHPPSSLFKG
jgi:hypothetical protein